MPLKTTLYPRDRLNETTRTVSPKTTTTLLRCTAILLHCKPRMPFQSLLLSPLPNRPVPNAFPIPSSIPVAQPSRRCYETPLANKQPPSQNQQNEEKSEPSGFLDSGAASSLSTIPSESTQTDPNRVQFAYLPPPSSHGGTQRSFTIDRHENPIAASNRGVSSMVELWR